MTSCMLALGPNATSVVLRSDDLGEALVEITLHGAAWIAERRDALGVAAGASAADVAAALAREGWRVDPLARSLCGRFTLHAEDDDDVLGRALAQLGPVVDRAVRDDDEG